MFAASPLFDTRASTASGGRGRNANHFQRSAEIRKAPGKAG
jgi:hypothetical protein